jgi:hypothetical protein
MIALGFLGACAVAMVWVAAARPTRRKRPWWRS